MKTITEEQLKEILEKHKLWLENKEGGEKADLSYADLAGVDLCNANLKGANLQCSNLNGADLGGADLSNALLYGASFVLSNLKDANMSNADLGCANFSQSNLQSADLSGAKLVGANMEYADLKGTLLENKTISKTTLGCGKPLFYFGQDSIQLEKEVFPIKHWIQNHKEVFHQLELSKKDMVVATKFIYDCYEDYYSKQVQESPWRPWIP